MPRPARTPVPSHAVPFLSLNYEVRETNFSATRPTTLLHLPLGHDGVADGGRRRRLRRAVILHIAALGLLDGGAEAEADLVLIRLDLHDLEIVALSDVQHLAGLRSGGARRGLGPVAFMALFDFRDVAEAFDSFGHSDERA